MKSLFVIYRPKGAVSPLAISKLLEPLGSVKRGASRHVETIFYDTFDWRLYADRKSLAAQTVDGESEINVCDHDEQETIATLKGEVATGFARDFPAGRVRDLMKSIIDVRRLTPRLLVSSKQTLISVCDKEGKTVLRVALDVFRAHEPENTRSVPLGTHITLEPVRGYTRVEQAAREVFDEKFEPLSRDLPLHQEGLQALGIVAGDYSSKLNLCLDPEMTAIEAARAVHLTLLDIMEQNEEGRSEYV